MSKHGKQPKPRDDLPYWRRAHRDWRVVGVVLMLIAITVYVMSDDLALQPSPEKKVPSSGASLQ